MTVPFFGILTTKGIFAFGVNLGVPLMSAYSVAYRFTPNAYQTVRCPSSGTYCFRTSLELDRDVRAGAQPKAGSNWWRVKFRVLLLMVQQDPSSGNLFDVLVG